MIEIGTAEQAIEFALEFISDYFEMYEFLNDWMHGDIDKWIKYIEWLKKQPTLVRRESL